MTLKDRETQDVQEVIKRAKILAQSAEFEEELREQNERASILSKNLHEQFSVKPDDPAWREPLS
jgi:hypothetical protein